jgi:endonuclease YncB( thermonuclease family)
MLHFIDRWRRRRPANDQILLADIVDQHDKASGANAQRSRTVRRSVQDTRTRPVLLSRRDRTGWLRLTLLILIFAGLVMYVVIDPPRVEGIVPKEWIDREFVGSVRVVDGDTVSMRGRRLRLAGIDAPERAQTCTRDGKTWNCGERSSEALANWIGERILICLGSAIDKYGRPVVRCTVGGVDVAAWSTGNGWSLAGPIGSTEYKQYEDQARRMRQGIWSGEFIPPWEWRAAHSIDNQ